MVAGKAKKHIKRGGLRPIKKISRRRKIIIKKVYLPPLSVGAEKKVAHRIAIGGFTMGVIVAFTSILIISLVLPELFMQKQTNIFIPLGNLPTRRSMPVIAVETSDNGTTEGFIISMDVLVYPSNNGLISIAVPPYAGLDLQMSTHNAVLATERYLGISLDNIAIIVHFDTEVLNMSGSSASAALAVALVSILENKQVDNSYMVSAEIWADGLLIPVGEITTKWEVAHAAGYILVVSTSQTGIDSADVRRVYDISELINLLIS